jgi:hypothetical protein
MELSEFVQRTIQDVVKGVKDAIPFAEKGGARIAVGNTCNIEFDVAVTTVEAGEKKGGAGIFIWAVGLGGQAKSEVSSSTVTRIKFPVQVSLPQSAVGQRYVSGR